MKVVRVLHERCTCGVTTALAVYERDDGSRVYGVSQGGEVKMTGTKAEAKAFYGSWRKTC